MILYQTGPRMLSIGLILALAAACDSGKVAPQNLHIDSLPRLTLTQEQKLGSVTDPNTGFSFIASVDVDRDGNVYVMDASDLQIRVYDPKLNLLRRIGRRGQGPGEFENGPRFGVKGDTVWALELTRINLFSRTGEILSSGKTPGVKILLPGKAIGTVYPYGMRRDGLFTSEFMSVGSSRNAPESGVKETDSIPVPRVLFDATGSVVDTIGWDDKPPPRMWRAPGSYKEAGFEIIRIGGAPFMVPDAPTEMPEWHALDDGRIIVDVPQPMSAAASDFAIVRLGLAKDTVYQVRLRYTPIKYESAELDSIAMRASSGMGGMVVQGSGASQTPQTDPTIAAKLRAAMKFPEFKLPIQSSEVFQDESVWVRPVSAPGSAQRWIVVDARGKVEGEVELPPRTRILWRKGDVIWASQQDESDVPWLVQFRIQRAG